MACKTSCKLCRRLIISTDVTFTAGTGLIITIPSGSYNDGEKYCIVVSQSIPTDTTINAPVYIRLGADTPVLYPLHRCNCLPAVACNLRSRHRYSTRVETTSDSGIFKLLGRVACSPDNRLNAINGDGTRA